MYPLGHRCRDAICSVVLTPSQSDLHHTRFIHQNLSYSFTTYPPQVAQLRDPVMTFECCAFSRSTEGVFPLRGDAGLRPSRALPLLVAFGEELVVVVNFEYGSGHGSPHMPTCSQPPANRAFRPVVFSEEVFGKSEEPGQTHAFTAICQAPQPVEIMEIASDLWKSISYC